MNLTLLVGILCLLVWLAVMFAWHNGSGSVQILWAVAVVLFTRRVLVGAPRFLS